MTESSLVDLDEAAEYIRQDSPASADKLAGLIIARCRSLVHFPLKFQKVGVSRTTGFPVHRTIVHPYLIYYRVEAGVVLILTIRHEYRRPLKKFD